MEENKAKRNIFVLLLTLTLVSVVTFIYIKPFVLKNSSPLASLQSDQPKNYTEISIAESNAFYNIEGSYPQFQNIDPVFNSEIENLVITILTEFKDGAEGNWKAMREISPSDYPTETPPQPFPFYVTWDVVYEDDRYISLLVTAGGFLGGAHGYENLYSFNYDKTTAKSIQLKDLFPADFDYLGFVSVYSKEKLVQKFKNMSLEENDVVVPYDSIEFGTEKVDTNFSVFTFDKDNLYIHFPEYAVAPYVYGKQLVTISRTEIESAIVSATSTNEPQ